MAHERYLSGTYQSEILYDVSRDVPTLCARCRFSSQASAVGCVRRSISSMHSAVRSVQTWRPVCEMLLLTEDIGSISTRRSKVSEASTVLVEDSR